MNGFVRKALVVSGFLACGFILSGLSCEEDKVPSCNDAMDSFYDASCWLTYYGEPLSESAAENICEDLKDDADNNGCSSEFDALAECFDAAENEYNCNDCDGLMADVVACIDGGGGSDGDADGDGDGDGDGDADGDGDSDGDSDCNWGTHSEPSCSDCASWEYCEPGSSSSGVYCLQPCESSSQCCAPLTCQPNKWHSSAQINICSDDGF